jgi:hypothetical protein
MTSTHPLHLWKDHFDIWEKHAARYSEVVLSNPLFLEGLGRSLEVSLSWQQAALQTVELAQRSLGIATRPSQERLQHQLNQLATQVNQLARRTETLESEQE